MQLCDVMVHINIAPRFNPGPDHLMPVAFDSDTASTLHCWQASRRSLLACEVPLVSKLHQGDKS